MDRAGGSPGHTGQSKNEEEEMQKEIHVPGAADSQSARDRQI
jgi:hypothetical protein